MATRVQTFEEFVLADPEGRNWELHDGQLVEKPSMSAAHNEAMFYFGRQLGNQLNPRHYRVRVNSGHLRHLQQSYFVPDVAVLPAETVRAQFRRPGVLEFYPDPLPLVIELWSPSTGGYDVNTKIPEYQRRGDLEIWRFQPIEQVLTAYRRELDESYSVTKFQGGKVKPVAIPDVTIHLDALFDLLSPSTD